MVATTTAGLIWPARLAYTAVGIFAVASAGTNLIYGWQKGSDLVGSIVWSAVSVAVSIVFSLSWPALLRSIDAKEWARAAMVLVALAVTGSYSVSAALGSAMGGRANAAVAEKDNTDRRTRLQAAYDTAKTELDRLTAAKPAMELQSLVDNAKTELAKLPGTRSVAEIEALIRGAGMNPRGSHGCTALNGSLRMSCPKLEAEKARAAQRERLTTNIVTWTEEIHRATERQAAQREKAKAAMDSSASELARTGPTKVANSDAMVLAVYLQALGLKIDADRVNKLLVLLAVLVIECGGGLSLAVGLSLSGAADTWMSGRTQDERAHQDSEAGQAGEAVTQLALENACPPRPDMVPIPAPPQSTTTARSVSGVRLLDFIRERGGVLSGGQRAMAGALGWSKSRLHEVLHELAGEGAVNLRADKTGTVVRLVS